MSCFVNEVASLKQYGEQDVFEDHTRRGYTEVSIQADSDTMNQDHAVIIGFFHPKGEVSVRITNLHIDDHGKEIIVGRENRKYRNPDVFGLFLHKKRIQRGQRRNLKNIMAEAR